MYLNWPTAILASLAMLGNSLAQPVTVVATAAVTYSIAVQLSEYRLVFVEVLVNGEPARALVDTGSSAAVRVSERMAQRLRLDLKVDPASSVTGLDGRRLALQRGRLETLTVGDLALRQVEVEVAARRIEDISAQVGTPFDVVLGWGFLSRYHFALDYPKRLLRFSASPLPPPTQGLTIPYSIVNRLPVVTASIAGQSVQLLVDTGAPMCNIDAAFANTAIAQIVSRELVLDGKPQPVEWRVKDLAVTRNALGTVATLGNNLLGRHTLHVDILRQTITLD